MQAVHFPGTERMENDMGIFLKSSNLSPVIKDALASALRVNPVQLADVQGEAANRTTSAIQQLTMEVAWPRLLLAVVFALALLGLAIWTAKANLLDISKELMTSFQAYSGLVVGLLGGEVAASKN